MKPSITTVLASAVFLILMALSPSSAQGDDPGTNSITAVRRDSPIRIDGILDEPAWAGAPPVTEFIQRDPDEGRSATESTEVRVLYDDEALYIGFTMYDSQPDSIAGELTRRDRWSESDWAGVQIDSYHDHRTGYAFSVNPAGVQLDRHLYNDTRSDRSWDAVWESATRITSVGWTAEFRIPYTSLRFPSRNSQVWGIFFSRSISRKKEWNIWPFIPKEKGGWVSNFGHLVGIQGIKPARQLEFLPYVVSRGDFELKNRGNPDGRDLYVGAGIDIKYGIASNITFNATVNPDFGQVEADRAVLNLSTFETFFPEKRPFFMEGAKIFDTPLQLFYSRRIGRPPSKSPEIPEEGYLADKPSATTILTAVKVTGRREGGTSFGILDAITQEEKAVVVDSTEVRHLQTIEPASHYGVLRLQREVLENSTIGILMTAANHRGEGPAYSWGVDWSLNLFDNHYSFQGQIAASRTGPKYNGWGGDFSFRKGAGKHFRGSTGYKFQTRRFDINDLGFLRRSNYHGGYTWLQYRITDSIWIIRKIFNNFNIWYSWNYDGDDLGKGSNFNSSMELKNYWWVGGWVGRSFGYLDDRETRGGPPVAIPGQVWYGTWVNTDSRKAVQLNFYWSSGDDRDGSRYLLGTRIRIRPKTNIELTFGSTHSRSWGISRWLADTTDVKGERVDVFGELESRQLDLRLDGGVTFTRNLSLQFYSQVFLASGDYTNLKRLLSADTFGPLGEVTYDKNHNFNSRSFYLSTVLRWEYRPGSTLFFVWTQDRKSSGETGGFDLKRDADKLFDVHPENTFLIKVSHWLSM